MSNYDKPPCRIIDPDVDALRATEIAVAIALLLILLTGCVNAPERVVLPPTEVEIPVMVPCAALEHVPEPPKYEAIEGDYIQRQAAILTNRERKKVYLNDLEVIVNSCKGGEK